MELQFTPFSIVLKGAWGRFLRLVQYRIPSVCFERKRMFIDAADQYNEHTAVTAVQCRTVKKNSAFLTQAVKVHT